MQPGFIAPMRRSRRFEVTAVGLVSKCPTLAVQTARADAAIQLKGETMDMTIRSFILSRSAVSALCDTAHRGEAC